MCGKDFFESVNELNNNNNEKKEKIVKFCFLAKKNKIRDEKKENRTEKIEELRNEIIGVLEKIGQLIKKGEYESLKDFYSQIIFDSNYKYKLKVLNGKKINESAIYNIIRNKFCLAKKEKIDIELEVNMDFKRMSMKPYELSKILGILLDNAIEATKMCQKKYIFISLVSEKEKDIIKIYNTYNDTKNIDMNKIFLKGYSTKKGNTGLGLWEIKKILLKHTNLDLYTKKAGNIFIQEFCIYRNNDNELYENHNIEMQEKENILNLTKDTIMSLKHDYNNILQAIGGYIRENDFSGLKEYYNDLLIDCEWICVKR